MDGSIVFDSWYQCALPCGYIGATWRILLNLCFFGPPESTTEMANQLFQPFLDSSCRKSLYFTMGDPFPQNCPFSWGIWIPIYSWFLGTSSQSKWHDDRFSCFSHRWPQSVPTLYYGQALSPKIAPSHRGSGPQFNTILWAHLTLEPKQNLDWFSCFCIDDRRVSLYFTTGCPFPPPNYPFPYGISTPI